MQRKRAPVHQNVIALENVAVSLGGRQIDRLVMVPVALRRVGQ